MRKKRILLLVCLLLALSQAVCAEGIAGVWKGNITASKRMLGTKFSKKATANVVFTMDGAFELKAMGKTLAGSYELLGDQLKLTSSGSTKTLQWSRKGDVLTITGKMDAGGYKDISTKMRVERVKPKVSKVSATKFALGTPGTFTIKTNAIVTRVEIADAEGNILAESQFPFKAKTFKIEHTFTEKIKKVFIRAATNTSGEIEWSKAKAFKPKYKK